MPAPVLTQLFIAQSKLQETFLAQQFLLFMNPFSARRHLIAFAQLQYQYKDPYTQPPEPILFPKLQIYFADFPFLLDFYGPEAANLGDLMQLWVRPGVWVHLSFSFSRTGRSAPDTSDDKVICPPLHPISKQSDFRENCG